MAAPAENISVNIPPALRTFLKQTSPSNLNDALHRAIYYGLNTMAFGQVQKEDLDLVGDLIHAGADVNGPLTREGSIGGMDRHIGLTPLQLLMKTKHKSPLQETMACVLLQAGANPHQTVESGRVPMPIETILSKKFLEERPTEYTLFKMAIKNNYTLLLSVLRQKLSLAEMEKETKDCQSDPEYWDILIKTAIQGEVDNPEIQVEIDKNRASFFKTLFSYYNFEGMIGELHDLGTKTHAWAAHIRQISPAMNPMAAYTQAFWDYVCTSSNEQVERNKYLIAEYTSRTSLVI